MVCWFPSCARGALAFLAGLLLSANLHAATDLLTWNTNSHRVSADLQSVPLLRLLEGVSHLTGWHVFVESNAARTVSVKFSDLPSGEALRTLLGNLNFALVPETNGPARLYVFHTLQRNATVAVHAGKLGSATNEIVRIPDELELVLKPGALLGNLPCLENAKVIGKMENSYRLKFENAEEARRVRECLASHPDVESVDSPLVLNRPDDAQRLAENIGKDLSLDLKEPSGDCAPIIAAIDTGGMQNIPENLRKFLMDGITVTDNPAPANNNELTHGLSMVMTMLQGAKATSTDGGSSARILPVDVFGANATTTSWDITVGMQRAYNAGANIINLSLGSEGGSPAMENMIKRLSEKGVVIFGAAGNQPVTTPTYPAAYPEVIAVTAGNRSDQIADYANRGAFVDIMTPGTSVITLNGRSYVVNGTSAATAFASGLAAGLAGSSGNCPPAVISTMKSKLPVPAAQ